MTDYCYRSVFVPFSILKQFSNVISLVLPSTECWQSPKPARGAVPEQNLTKHHQNLLSVPGCGPPNGIRTQEETRERAS